MASQAGRGAKLYYQGLDISGNWTGGEMPMDIEVADDTAWGDVFRTGVIVLRAGGLSLEGNYDTAAGGSDAVFGPKVAGGTVEAQTFVILPGGDADGRFGYMAEGTIANYTPSMPVDDIVRASVELTIDGPYYRPRVFHALAAEGSSGSSTGVDNLVATTNGGAAMIQFTDSAGSFGTFDLDIEESATGSFSGEENTLASFTQITANDSSELITITGAMKRHLRLNWTLATITSATFWVGIHRYVG